MVELPTHLKNIELIILDMDGVLTSEEAYWDAAGLVTRDILESSAYLGLSPPEYTPILDVFYRRLANGTRTDWRKYLSIQTIVNCKSRGINSNWDLAFLNLGLYLVQIFAPVIHELTETGTSDDSNSIDLSELQEILSPIWDRLQSSIDSSNWTDFLRKSDFHLWGEYFRNQKRSVVPIKNIGLRIMDDFHPDIKGLALLDELNALMVDTASKTRYPLFGRNTRFWHDCQDLFQEWYLGEELYQKTYNRPIIYRPKPGLIHKEEPLHGRQKTHALLTKLRDAGFQIGVATGRPRMEILTPLQEWDMLDYFDSARIITHDEVVKAETECRSQGIHHHLGKPHPYAFLQAIFPDQPKLQLAQHTDQSIPEAHKILIVGDALADIWAAHKIHCPCAALLSGAISPASRRRLEDAHPTVICNDLPELVEALVTLKSN